MTELETLAERLEVHTKGCEEKCIDLQTLRFSVEEGDMRLYNNFHSYFFKRDPKNPRDPKIIHAAKQFCKMMGVPYSFFAKNPERMKTGMVECWLPTLTPDKSVILAKLRPTSEKDYVIRALLPVQYTNITNAEVVRAVAEVIDDEFRIEFAIGEERDDLVLHIRFISREEFDAFGEPCAVGFSVVASELGEEPLSVETLLYRSASKASFIASYNQESFFSFEYESIQRDDLKKMFPPLITHLRSQLGEVKEKIQRAKEVSEEPKDITELLKNLRLQRGLNEKFHRLLAQEMDEKVKTLWDFANKMAVLAKDFEVDKRIRIEREAGALIGLTFDKS